MDRRDPTDAVRRRPRCKAIWFGGGVAWTVAFVLGFATGIAVAVASAFLWLIVKLLVP